ncbi:GNAT family N-acetyltransferase [Bacillus atrophaeus]|uniref:GNAT family N-acetyltransferase n=1 Tax=Bacillus atrophaeus TaxID=1452 RepID=UPI000D05C253|nr:GNAT family protein [Bacillus atrophaeus]PSA92955.1 GNAT family N-acetyltransferase [Bacillus atrophaeus]WNV78483.1 GNAT family protein [Bacillus atrophaeus]
MQINQFGQKIGEPVKGYQRPLVPKRKKIAGKYCTLEKVSIKHFDDLYKNVYGSDSDDKQWTYLPIEKFTSEKEFEIFLSKLIKSEDPFYYAIVDNDTNEALGSFSLMRINIENSSVEVGHVIYSERLKKTRIATEAQFLLARYVFEELHYRRYEWKCDSLNDPSRKAALRLGFQYEGTFRQALVYKQRNRDTAWFSIIDKEWPNIKNRFEKWLLESNFDEYGNQMSKLDNQL